MLVLAHHKKSKNFLNHVHICKMVLPEKELASDRQYLFPDLFSF